MKKFFYPIAFAAAVLAFGSCSNEDATPVEPPKYITVTTEISAMTRVATDSDGNQSFENGDVISVYAWTGTNKEGES